MSGRNVITSITLALLISACSAPPTERIVGAWKMDSLYDYYNGFTYMNRHPYPAEVHSYRADNTLLREGMGEQLLYTYECIDSTVVLKDTHGRITGEFQIVNVDNEQLVLKKTKKPLFDGKNQEHYEVHFFSRQPAKNEQN